MRAKPIPSDKVRLPLKVTQRMSDIEALARMAARIAGRDPDRHLTFTLAGETVFDDLTWRYPDFLRRAEAAYAVLTNPGLPSD